MKNTTGRYQASKMRTKGGGWLDQSARALDYTVFDIFVEQPADLVEVTVQEVLASFAERALYLAWKASVEKHGHHDQRTHGNRFGAHPGGGSVLVHLGGGKPGHNVGDAVIHRSADGTIHHGEDGKPVVKPHPASPGSFKPPASSQQSETEGYVPKAAGKYFWKTSVKEAVAQMQKKYPKTKFEFDEKSDVSAVNTVLQEADRLFTTFPDVGSKMLYVGDGTGKKAPPYIKGYFDQKGKQLSGGACWNLGSGRSAIAVSPRIMKKHPSEYPPQLVSYNPETAGKIRHNVSFAHDTILTHEFGHAIHNYLLEPPANASYLAEMIPEKGDEHSARVPDLINAWSQAHRSQGNKVSQYAATNELENFAEGFLALAKLPPKQWPEFSWEQKKLLDAFLSPHQDHRLPLHSGGNALFQHQLKPKEVTTNKKKLAAIYNHFGISPNATKGVTLMHTKAQSSDGEMLDPGDGWEKVTTEEGETIYVEATPPGGPETEAWLQTPGLDTPDTSGDTPKDEVTRRLSDEITAFNELLAILASPDEEPDQEDEE